MRLTAVCLVGLSIVMIASVTWSVAPQLTGWRSWIYAGMALGGWRLATLPLAVANRIVATFAIGCAALSVVVLTVSRDIGVDEFGAWRGVYLSPNSLAPIAGLVAIVAIGDAVATFTRPAGQSSVSVPRIAVDVGLLVGAYGLIAKAQSVTPAIAVVLALGTAGGLWVVRNLLAAGRTRDAVTGLAVAGCLAVTAGFVMGPRLWSTSHFELRRELWGHIVDRIAVHPIRGHGHFAFWDVPALLEPRLLVRTGSSHNSFLEILLSLGVIGFVLFVPVMIGSVVQPLRQMWRMPSAEAFVWLSIAIFLFLENLTESFVLWFSYMWLLVIASALRPVTPRPTETQR